MSDLIVVSNVHKRYGSKPVLRGVDLTVRAGEVRALLGANGAGKTTLIRLICGLAKADKGAITLGGVPVSSKLHELRRYVGVVSHQPMLYDALTGMENLRFFAELYGVRDTQARCESALRQVDLFARRNDVVRTYSRGMVQRLAIARATLHNPPVLLLDEPDTGLDPASAATLQELLRSLGNAARAILLTTHNVQRALSWADSVSVLANGRMAEAQASVTLDAAQVEHALAGAP